ncbi:MAG: ABC transporter ATP-binding protein [Candidatus Eremiobacteraeota bacterium]|nr:ABC transporter ATP-binding protein [Candidatus Eremiobacteraeota bacterium]
MSTISIRDLTKTYNATPAVQDLSLDVEPGSVFGLLGPNGAGKTTTFKCMLGLAQPSNGTILYEGEPLTPARFETLSYVPEKSVLYDWMTVGQHLEMQRRAFARFDGKRAAELMNLFSLDPKKRVRNLSKGMRTMVALVMAFSTQPEILVLDEPTSGLDPINQRAVLNLLVDAAARGVTVVFSSHQIGQVERAADTIAILQRGRLLLSGAVDDLKAGWKIVEGIFPDDRFAINGIASDPRVHRVDRAGRIVRLSVEREAGAVGAALQAVGAESVREVDLNLEDIFLNAVDPKSEAGAYLEAR